MRFAAVFTLLLSCLSCERRSVAPFGDHAVTIPVHGTLERLVHDEDTDGDKKITVEDGPTGERGRGDQRFELITVDGRRYDLEGVYHLSNLLQELKFAELEGRDALELQPDRVLEPPTSRISRLIRERYWDGLTRRIDADHLEAILEDEKAQGTAARYFYVAHDDDETLKHFDAIATNDPGLRLRVVQLGESLGTAQYDGLFETVRTVASSHPGSLHYLLVPEALFGDIQRRAVELPELRLRIEPLPREIPPDLFQCLSEASQRIREAQRNISPYLYVPGEDVQARDYFTSVANDRSELRLKVERLPDMVSPAYVESLRGHHGLLALALRNRDGGWTGVPFVVPGGRFNEMYGWDSYFEAVGLLQDGRVELSKAMVDNFVYQIRYYGKILNANRTYYLTRSQPPFFTTMVLTVYQRLEKSDASKRWLADALWAAIGEYENVWTAPGHLDDQTGLSRYFGTGLGQPPEVEPGHFDDLYSRIAAEIGLIGPEVECRYARGPHPPSLRSGTLSQRERGDRDSPSLPAAIRRRLDEYFRNDRCMRESGHDTTYRWDIDGNRCADFLTVDLNSLLYKVELDLARTIEKEFGGTLAGTDDDRISTAELWRERARRRRQRIRELLWDPRRSLFFDYDKITDKRHEYVAATTLYPLWAWDPEEPSTSILREDEVARFVDVAIGLLKAPGGVLASTEASRGPLTDERRARQWDFPNGWAPHQMIAWAGLGSRGYDEMVQELVYRWLYTITRNAVDYNGTIPEKFDVVERSHQVFAEYGNVGTEFDYITEEGFGWMNASFQVGLALLEPHYRASLDRLVPPEELFGR